MPGPTFYKLVEPTTPTSQTSRHRQGHSITTNASGIADSTISYGTVDALHSQLCHFPPPPSELPTPTTPSFPIFFVPVAPLNLPRRNPYPDVPSESSRQPRSQPPPIRHPPEEPIQPNGTVRPLMRRQSFRTYATNGTVGSLSPFDWHEGSSSIDVEPNDDRLLPTSFITSLISSSGHGSPNSPTQMSPLQSSAQLFSGGINLDTISLISDTTYPPHNYPPVPSPTRAIPPGSAYLVTSGRSSKRSSAGALTADTEYDKPSVQSHSPLINLANRYEPIAEDTVGELQARGEASKHLPAANTSKWTSHGRRQSLVSTRTTKSYVSSLISKLSRATSKKRTTTKPLPPVPTIPTEMRDAEYQKFEESMPLPQLANRAEVLSKMLAWGHRPHSGRPPSSVHRSTPTPGVEVQWNGFTQTLEPSRSNWHTTRESSYGYYSGEKVETSNRPAGFRDRLVTRFGKKRIIAMLIVIAVLLIVLAVLLGVLLRKKSTPVLPKCPAGKTGTDCDIGPSSFPIFFRVSMVLSRADLAPITLRPQLRVVCVLAGHRARVWLRVYLTYFRRQTLPST
jgi:hypothetical protein